MDLVSNIEIHATIASAFCAELVRFHNGKRSDPISDSIEASVAQFSVKTLGTGTRRAGHVQMFLTPLLQRELASTLLANYTFESPATSPATSPARYC